MVNVVDYLVAQGPEFDASTIAAPHNLQQMIERNLERLSEDEQRVLEAASVAGAKEPITWPDGTIAAGFRFHHALYEETLYGRLPASHRIELHRRIAQREETAYGERANEIAAELAHHYSSANEREKAIKFFQSPVNEHSRGGR